MKKIISLLVLFSMLMLWGVQVKADVWTWDGATYSSSSKGYEKVGVGTLYKGTAGGTSNPTVLVNTCGDEITNGYKTSSSIFYFSPAVDISGLKIVALQDNNRSLVTLKKSATLGGTYADVTASLSSNFVNTKPAGCDPRTITFSATAGEFLQFTFSGNITISSIELVVPTPPITDPLLNATPATLESLQTAMGVAITTGTTVNVTGENLTKDLTASIMGAGSKFSISSGAAIAKEAAMLAAGANVVLAVDVAAAGTFTDTLLISSEEISKKIPLKVVVTSADFTVSPASISASTKLDTVVTGKSVTITGTNLTADLLLTMAAGGSGKFSFPVAQQSITAAAANAGAVVPFTINVAAGGTFKDTLIITSSNGEAEVVRVPLEVAVKVPLIPTTTRTITSNTTVYANDAAFTNTAAGEGVWAIVQSYTIGNRAYTNLSTDAVGNRDLVTDNLASATVPMITVKPNSTPIDYFTDGRFIHMRVTGVTGVIVHGMNANAARRGIALAYNEADNLQPTANPILVDSISRVSGSCLIHHEGLDATKTYIISVYGVTGDAFFYAIEFIAGAISTPVITADPGVITGLSTSVGTEIAEAGRTINVKGANLTANLSLTMAAGGSGKFTVPAGKQSIAFADANASAGVNVALSVNVAAAGTFKDTLIITSSNVEATAVRVPLQVQVIAVEAGNKAHYITSSDIWNTIIGAATFKSGDTLVVPRGTVTNTTITGVAASKSFVIRAAEGAGARPKWKTNNSTFFSVSDASAPTPAGNFIVLDGIDFENGNLTASPIVYGGYLFSHSNATVGGVAYGRVELKNCNISGFQTGFRWEQGSKIEELIVDNCVFSDICLNRTGYVVFQIANVGTATIKNSTFYNIGDAIWKVPNTGTFLMENCTVFEVGSTAMTNAVVDGIQYGNNGTGNPSVTFNCLGTNAVYTFRNNLFRDYWKRIAANAQVTAFFGKGAGVTVNGINNMHSGIHQPTDIVWDNGTASRLADNGNWEFTNAKSLNFTITGADEATMRRAGAGGACVGDPRSYVGYVPPVPADVVWSGANGALWNVATNWTPNELPGALGSGTISNGTAQSSGGVMDTKIILATGGTLQLAATPDTITTLELCGGTLVGANAINGAIKTFKKSTISVPTDGTFTIPVGVEGADTLVKVGAGTLHLTVASNSFSGVWRIEAGNVKVAGAGLALGTEVKVDLRGGKLELDGEMVFLPGFAYANGVAIPVGTYTATSGEGYVAGSGTLRVTASRVFKWVFEGDNSDWNDKFKWYPVRNIVAGDTALVTGSYATGETSTKAYNMQLQPNSFPAGAKLFVENGARARFILGALAANPRSAFSANIETSKGYFYTSTSSLNVFGLDGTLTIKDTTYFQNATNAASDTATILDNKISKISIGATLKGSKPIVLMVGDATLANSSYGIQMVKANNTDFTGDWLIQNTNLVGKAESCFGRANTIYLSAGTKLYCDVADATEKTQSVVVEDGARIMLNGDTRLISLKLGSQTYTTGEFTEVSHPAYISGTGSIKLGVVSVTSVVISTPDSVQAAVKGATMQFSAVAYPLNADDRNITWSIASGDATVNAATGLVTFGNAAGSVNVKAQTLNGVSATKTMPVLDAAQQITNIALSGPSSMDLGQQVVYVATYTPANATSIKMKWEITAGTADTVHLSNNRLQVVSTSSAPLTIKVSSVSAPSVTASKTTTIIRATKYNWVVNNEGLWTKPMYWNPQVVPVAGDSGYIAGNTTTSRLMLGSGGQSVEDQVENIACANFAANLFMMKDSQARLGLVSDSTSGLDPFTSAWDAVPAKWRITAPFQMSGGTLGIYSTSAKTWLLDGTLNMVDSSFLFTTGASDKAGMYLFTEVKGSAPLVLTGDDARLSNDPAESRANFTYAQSTVFLRRANPQYTGKFYLRFMNLYTNVAGGFGKADIHVGTGRKLFVDNEHALDTAATIYVETGGKISTKLKSSITVNVKSLVLNGVAQPVGFYSKQMPAVSSYFEDNIIVKVGNAVIVPVTSIQVSGPNKVPVGSDNQYTALVLPSNSEQVVTWKVEPADLGSINESGMFSSGTSAGCVTITATATDETGISGSKQVAIGTGSCSTSAESDEFGALTLSPNPVVTELTVKGEKTMTEAKIYTINGTLMQVVAVNANEALVDMSGYATGTYFVVISYAGTDKKLTKIIVKQ